MSLCVCVREVRFFKRQDDQTKWGEIRKQSHNLEEEDWMGLHSAILK